MAFAAISTIAAGAEITAGIALLAVAEVGTVLSVVGGLTGNAALSKIGGTMALVGGIGAFATGGMGQATAALSSGGSEAAARSALSTGAWSDKVVGAGLETASSNLSSTVAPDFGGAVSDGVLQAPTMATPTTAQAVSPASTMPVGSAPTVNDVNSVVSPAGAPDTLAPLTPYETPTDMRLAAGTQTSPGMTNTAGATAPKSFSDYFKSFGAFAEKNKALFNGGLQLLGGALKGASEADTAAQRLALDQQRLNQTSYGNQIGTFAKQGIVNGARP